MDGDHTELMTRAETRHYQRNLLNALNETSANVRNGWLLFLALMGYMIVALAGVNHEALLLNTPVKLPMLNIGVSLDRFFLFAPLFLLFVHVGMIVQHIVLARKAMALNQLILRENRVDQGAMHPLRYELHSYFFTQAFAGPPHGSLLRGFLNSMMWMSLWVLPVMVLLYFQVAFLPYHDFAITAAHRVYLVADLLMLVVIGLFVHTPEPSFWQALRRNLTVRPFRFVAGSIGGALALFFSFFVATIPDGRLDRFTRSSPLFKPFTVPVPVGGHKRHGPQRYAFVLTAYMFEGGINQTTGKSVSFLQRNLVVTDRDLVPNKDDEFGEVALSLRNRDFRYATLDRSDLHRVDFTGADFTGASLVGTILRDARMSCPRPDEDSTELFGDSRPQGCTRLVATDLKKAQLQRADLRLAELIDVRLEEADLQDAKFQQAVLQGANLTYAKLKGANLSLAQLQGSDFSWSNLQGANFSVADMQGANLESAELQGANFSYAKLQGAQLSYAKLDGATFRNAKLQGADLSNAHLPLADFREAEIWQTVPPSKEAAELADMRGLVIQAPDADAVIELKDMMAGLKKGVRNAIRDRIAPLIDKVKARLWPDVTQQSVWIALKTESENRDQDRYRRNLTEALIDLACSDRSPRAFLATGLVRRAIYKFNGDPSLFYGGLLDEKRCPPGQLIDTELMEKLQRVASDYRRGGS